MNLKLLVSATLLAVALGAVSAPAGVADPGFAKRYRAPSLVPSWNRGSIGLVANGTGYAISASGPAPTNQPALASLSLARINPSGGVDWTLWATEGLMGYTTLTAHPTQPLVFAKIEGLAQEEFWTVFGVFDARDGTRVFERGIRVAVGNVGSASSPSYIPNPSTTVDYLSDGRSTVILEGSDSIVRVAVFDQAGQPQWENSLAAPSFAIAGSGPHSSLIEYPGHGFWLIVQGSQKITTQPNPPAINSAVTLNVVRFDTDWKVLWSKKFEGLETSEFRPPLEPVAIGADGSLVFSLTDEIFSPPKPVPDGFVSSVVALNPDGPLRWVRRIAGVAGTGLTPTFAPDASTLFLSGAKLRSLSPLSVDGLILKLDARNGDDLGQISIHPSTLVDLSIAGVAENRLFVRALAYTLTSPGPAYVGYFDLNLHNSTWKQLSLNKTFSADLSYDPRNGSILFSDFPAADSRIDVIQLDTDLNPLASGVLAQNPVAACQFFTPANITILNPKMIVENLSLTESILDVTIANTNIPLPTTTRIQLRTVTPLTEDLCRSDQVSSPHLSYQTDSTRSGVRLMFESQAGVSYELLFTPTLSQPFQAIEKLTGDGSVVERTLTAARDQNGFYAVRMMPWPLRTR